MPISTVKQLCIPSAAVTSEQVAQIEDFASGRVDSREFFRRNYCTRPRASGQCTHYDGNFVIQIKIEDGFARDATWAVWARKREVQDDPLEAAGIQKTKRRQPDTVPGFCVVRAKKDPRFLDGVMVGVVDGTIVRLQDCMTRASKT
jgi:hypothetical protein